MANHMENQELANKMINNLDWFKSQPDWEDDYKSFSEQIQQIMDLDGCNAMKAAMPIISKFQEAEDVYVCQLIVAIVTEMMIKTNTQ
jgi:hypothetical protein